MTARHCGRETGAASADEQSRRSGLTTDSGLRDASVIEAEIMALVEEYHAVAHAEKPFVVGTSAVPVSGRVFDASDIKSLVESSLEFWLTAGRFNDRFQDRLAKRIGAR